MGFDYRRALSEFFKLKKKKKDVFAVRYVLIFDLIQDK